MPRLRPLSFSAIKIKLLAYVSLLALVASVTGAALLDATGKATSSEGERAAPAERVAHSAPALPRVRQRESKEALPSEVVTLTRRGFEPAEITRPHGKFFLVVENRSDVRGITLRLDPEHGNRTREYTQPEDELDWTEEVHLTPGTYTLSVSGHSNWVCRINVTAH